MAYLFDSSAIYAITRARRTELLIQSGTCSLARYELCNILLTERHVRKRISESEQKYLLSKLVRALGFMRIMSIADYEQGIIDTAIELGLSFYDASYVHLAKKSGMVLVTEDAKLARKINGHVHTATTAELTR
ncbi:MAG: type II toxin-antitoxin system VapC family toxin [Candidatus Micrarchaeota archaeon]|nr:type II toxin-antitoxin system VapC family toxin [Candidatus Micrarchaeota archaeon]